MSNKPKDDAPRIPVHLLSALEHYRRLEQFLASEEKKMCVNCGIREVYPIGRNMDFCEACIWETVKKQ